MPPRLQGALPPQFVLFGDLNGVVIPPRARVLDQLCRRALQSYLLSDAWLNSRRFVDSDFRAPVEYVPTLSSMLRLQFASESERRTRTAGTATPSTSKSTRSGSRTCSTTLSPSTTCLAPASRAT